MLSMQGGPGGSGGLGAIRPVLEINPSHALVGKLEEAMAGGGERFSDLAFLLLDEARILEGGAPRDPAAFTARLNRLLLEDGA
jgi:molecular chaperone HtpG